MKKNYFTNCVSAKGGDITEMMDSAREVSYKTICQHIEGGSKKLAEMFGYSIGNDYSVSFYTGKFKGKKCAIVKHSAIEYIFI